VNSTKPSSDVNKITLTLIHRQLVNICDEMAVSMMRTAYSPIFSEGLDFSTLILDHEGNLIANAGLNPSMLGASLYAATWIVREVGAKNFTEGDVYVHNDPYRGGSHMPEHMMVMPVFESGELVGFIGNIAHMAEIGGMAPGSFAATATDVYQEGLRLPPILLYRNDEPVHDVWKIILSNHRTPNDSWGDLHAMYGSLKLGKRRLLQMIADHNLDVVVKVFSDIQDYTESGLRDKIRTLPNGIYYGEEWFEDDGITATPYAVRLSFIVDDDEIIFDFTRSDQQADGPINAPYVVTMSAALNALLYMIGGDLPVNAGLNRPVRIVTKAGTICCVRLPGSCVGGQTEYQPRIMEMIMGKVLGPLLPDKATAASGNTSLNFLFGGLDPRSGDYYAHYHFEATGWGGRAQTDGNNATMPPHANCRNTPVEIFESRWPWIHEQYSLKRQEVGHGEHRGGSGVVRIIEVAAETITVSALSDRAIRPPWGAFGGNDGSVTRIEISPAGKQEFVSFQEYFGLVSPTKFTNIRLHRGDRVRLTSPSGGGYGPPEKRDPILVGLDVRDGYITRDQAASIYQVVLDENDRPNATMTQALRKENLL
jgi:N-methylhydantoinase B/oxoprolinase/acetone carboxylase alpha subunit